MAACLVESLPTCPIPEIARLGRTLRKWKDAFLAYFNTGGASNGPTEAINGFIELGRRPTEATATPPITDATNSSSPQAEMYLPTPTMKSL